MVINFYQPLRSADFQKIDNNDDNEITRITWSRILSIKSLTNSIKPKFYKTNNNYLNRKNITKDIQQETVQQLRFNDNENPNELVIQSDKQSEKNNVIDAQGNVSVFYKGKILKGDRLIYDRSTKEISVNGNISFIHGARMFNSSSILNVEPKVGDFYIFPNYLMHSVNPFYGEEERRSVSFNAKIDESIYNVYE